jgi:Domain of unknown function (DUF6089)
MFHKIILAAFLAFSQASFAQHWELGGWLGTSFYQGDLTPNFSLKRPGFSGGAMVRYNFDKRFSLKAGASYLNVSGYDSDSDNAFQKQRNLSFASSILEGSLVGEFNFLPLSHSVKGDERFTPFLLLGVGVMKFDPMAEYNGRTYHLQPLGTEGQGPNGEYQLVMPNILYGGGFKFDLAEKWSLNIDFTVRYLFTDYLDDVSGKYADVLDLRDNRGVISAALSDRSTEFDPTQIPLGKPGFQRGDSGTMDSYFSIGIGLTYNFVSLKCPTF